MRTRMILLCVAVSCTCASLGLAGAVVRPWLQPAQPHQESPGAGAEESQIREVLDAQAAAWNRGDIDSFMTPYWKSDQTLFVGASGVARGYQAVLERYHKAYPNRQAMGRLTFSNMEVHAECADTATVIGQFQLQRENGRPAGVFTLNLRKFPEGWRIVLDHTTAFPSDQAAK
jgi:ketosteroid isomerase-like protein